MVLTHLARRVLAGVLVAGMLGTTGCIKQVKQIPRVQTSVPVEVAWVVDMEDLGPPVDPPAKLVAAGDAVFADRNLVPERALAEAWGDVFSRQRAAALRMSWLQERSDGEGIVALAELRPYFDNTSNGRYRWIVAVVLTVAPAKHPERRLEARFEVPVFLQFTYEGAEEALEAARSDVSRRLARLLDGVLQDAEAGWTLQDGVGALDMGGASDGAGGGRAEPPEGPIYFVMLDRFANGDPSNDGDLYDPDDPQGWHGGDLRGLIERLDHIHALGATTVWVSPLSLAQHGKAGETGGFHGYWMHEPSRLDPHWGSEQDLVTLREELDARGMSLVLDMVTNHVAYESLLPGQRPAWFHGQGNIEDWNDPVQVESGDVHGLPDLDQDVPAVRDWLIGAADAWMNRVEPDGFRLDAVRHVSLDFWSQYNKAVGKKGGPGFMLIGELFDGRPEVVADTWRRGKFRQMFDFPLRYALIDTVCGSQHLGKLGATLSLDRVYDRPERLITFLDNHDLPRVLTSCEGDEGRVMDALALQFGARGTPALTYGVESGLTGAGEPDNRSDMVFGDTSDKTYKRIQKLSALRSERSALTRGDTVVLSAKKRVLAWLRATEDDAVLVYLNRTDGPVEVALPRKFPKLDSVSTLVGGRRDAPVTVSKQQLVLPPGAARWVSLTPKSAKALATWHDKHMAPELVTVRFEVTGFGGKQLAMTGGAPELGHWDSAQGLSLVDEGSAWVGDLEVPAGTVLEYKLRRVADGAWEKGSNRYLQVGERDDTVRIAWKGPEK